MPDHKFISISAARNHTCGVTTENQLLCWGSIDQEEITPPDGLYTQVTSGGNHACAITTEGNAQCWGNNDQGQSSPPEDTFTMISAGREHTCGINMDGLAICWGWDEFGKGAPPEDTTFTTLNAGAAHTCGITTEEKAICWTWGDNSRGQATPPDDTFASINAGNSHTCGINTKGRALCWGYNLQPGDYNPQGPQHPRTSIEFASLSASTSYTCGITTEGEVLCWGGTYELLQNITPEAPFADLGKNGQCAVTEAGKGYCWHNRSQRENVPEADFATIVGWNRAGACGVTTQGQLLCWGEDLRGGPRAVFQPTSFSGRCGLTTSQEILCWGGAPSSYRRDMPEEPFLNFAIGEHYSCGITNTKRLKCWGSPPDYWNTPETGQFTHVELGDRHACAIKASDATLECWYHRDEEDNEPKVPPGSFDSISIYGKNFCGVTTEGNIECSALASEPYQTRLPKKIPEGTFKQVRLLHGVDNICALREDGVIICYGQNPLILSGR